MTCLVTAVDYLFIVLGDFLGLGWLERKLFSPFSFAVAAAGNAIWCNAGILAGSTVKYRFYSYLGLTALQIASLVTFTWISYFLGLFFLGGMTNLVVLFNLWISGGPISPGPGKWISWALLSAVFLYLGFSLLGRRQISIGRTFIPVPSFHIAVLQVCLASMDWLLAGTVLFTLLPQGFGLGFSQVTGTYVMAQITVLISQVPGGAGVFEGMVLLFLSRKINGEKVLATVLAFRIIFSIAPLIRACVFWGFHEIRGMGQSGK
ncbi:MAG: UPF0104 family protein [Synergistales bacterium]|nr:UPF0104 family protein [Synergistales bacterium]